MAWLPDGEKISKISLFVFAQLTNVTNRRTPGDGIYRAYEYASHGKNYEETVTAIVKKVSTLSLVFTLSFSTFTGIALLLAKNI